MTTEEAIEEMCDYCIINPCYALCNGDMCLSKRTLIEKIDKYKWHDLRKDPTDLPDTTRTVVVRYVLKGIEDESYVFNGMAFFGVGNSWFEHSINPNNLEFEEQGYQVLAWKEIEPFERGEEDDEC